MGRLEAAGLVAQSNEGYHCTERSIEQGKEFVEELLRCGANVLTLLGDMPTLDVEQKPEEP